MKYTLQNLCGYALVVILNKVLLNKKKKKKKYIIESVPTPRLPTLCKPPRQMLPCVARSALYTRMMSEWRWARCKQEQGRPGQCLFRVLTGRRWLCPCQHLNRVIARTPEQGIRWWPVSAHRPRERARCPGDLVQRVCESFPLEGEWPAQPWKLGDVFVGLYSAVEKAEWGVRWSGFQCCITTSLGCGLGRMPSLFQP